MAEESLEEQRDRLILVANRLPVTAKQAADGTWNLQARPRAPAIVNQNHGDRISCAPPGCDCPAMLAGDGAPTDVAAARVQVSAGGLVSALMGVDNFSITWVGWPGACWHADCGPALPWPDSPW